MRVVCGKCHKIRIKIGDNIPPEGKGRDLDSHSVCPDCLKEIYDDEIYSEEDYKKNLLELTKEGETWVADPAKLIEHQRESKNINLGPEGIEGKLNKK